jgi:tripartite-type tricarboxylate transporter receptor subunit TctC
MRLRVALAVVLALGTGTAAAQNYPTHAVQIMNPFQAGGTTDLLARALAAGLSAELGQPFVVINRDGAAGAVGTAVTANAKPDGYSLAFIPAVVLTGIPHLRRDVGYTLASFEPICHTFENTMALAVRPDSPFANARDFVEFAKKNPGKLKYGHQGPGSVPQLAMAELVQRSGIDVLEVAYRGDGAVTLDVSAGNIDAGAVVAGILAGRDLRVLGVFADERHPKFPDTPTFKELGLPVAQASFGGLIAPAGTPQPILDALAAACAKAVATEIYRTAAERGNQPARYYRDRTAFRDRLVEDDRIKSGIIKSLNLSQ